MLLRLYIISVKTISKEIIFLTEIMREIAIIN